PPLPLQARRRPRRGRGDRAARGGRRAPRRRDPPLRGGRDAADPRQAATAAPSSPSRWRAVPALRDDDRGGPLRELRPLLLPAGADRRQGAVGSPALASAEVSRMIEPGQTAADFTLPSETG